MKLLILGLNYAPERVGIAVYTSGMAETLSSLGHDVKVVAGQPYYPNWAVMAGYKKFGFSAKLQNGVSVMRVPHYVPGNPTGVRRLLHHVSFALSCSLPMLWKGLFWRPDVVMTVAPSLIAAPIAIMAAAIAGSKSWLHIQDIEVDAAFAIKLLREDKISGWFARAFERTILSSFTVVSTISPQMRRKLNEKGVAPERLVELRNWTDIDTIKPISSVLSQYRDEWSITTPHVALYSGNIANKQGIEIVVAAARALKDRNDLTFVICGEGPNRAKLQTSAVGLSNIRFYDLQPKELLNDLLGMATIHLLPQLAEAADLVLPSKLTNMLASGRPIVATAFPDTGVALEVEGCGLLCNPGDVQGFSAAIRRLIDDPDLSAQLSISSRQRAEAHWSGYEVLSNLNANLEALTSRRSC